LKKINASSDSNNEDENFLPSEILWRAAQMIFEKGVEVPPIDSEPAPLEVVGLTIGILRRRKHIPRSKFVKKIGCSVEELLALEAGLLPAGELAKYLPLILKEINMPELSLHPIFRNIKFA
jgi:hypothetical protein